MQLAVSNIAWPPEERIAAYTIMADAGFTGLEIAPSVLFAHAHDPFAPPFTMVRAVQREIGAFGLSMASMQSLFHHIEGAALFGDRTAYEIFMMQMARVIDLAGALEIPNLVFGSPKQRRIPMNMEYGDSIDIAAEAFSKLAARAVDVGTQIAIEPCPALYGTNFLNTFQDASAFVSLVDAPGLITMFDMGGAQISGSSLPDAAEFAQIGHVHISSPYLMPAPIDGDLTGEVLALLVEAGYDRTVSIEMMVAEGGMVAVAECIKRLRGAVNVALKDASLLTLEKSSPVSQIFDEVPRSDVLVSVCISGINSDPKHSNTLLTLAKRLMSRFQFWELIVVDTVESIDTFLPLVQDIPNMRLFGIGMRYNLYRERAIAASEAIGDAVAIAAIDEVPHLDIVAMLDRAVEESRLIQAVRPGPPRGYGVLEKLIVKLGRAAGFNVSLRYMQTIALPRARLAQLLNHSDRELALRFPPRDLDIEPGLVDAFGVPAEDYSSTRTIQRRMLLLERLLVNLAPRVLTYVSIISGGLVVAAAGYFIYVLTAWLVIAQLEPGWVTLSTMLSLSTAFLGLAICGLSLGLQNLLRRPASRHDDENVTEINRVNVFSQISDELNAHRQ